MEGGEGKQEAVADKTNDGTPKEDEGDELGVLDRLAGLRIEDESKNKKRRLIVLDLNGLLIFRVFARDKGNYAHHLATSHKVNDFFVWKRPHVDAFLDWLMDRYAVGIWSSAMHHNVDKLIAWTLGEERRKRLVFEWDQTKCPQEKHPTHKHKPLFLKPLASLWEVFPEWNESNTLLVDDSPLKAKRNPPHLLFSPPEWTIDVECGKGELGQGGDIRKFLEALYDFDGTVAEFVQSNLH